MRGSDVTVLSIMWKNHAIFHDSSYRVSSPQIPLNKHELLIAYIFQIIQHLVSNSSKLYFWELSLMFIYFPISLQTKTQEEEKYKSWS